MKEEPRNLNLDFIRVLAIIAVVFIHLTFPIYSRPDFFGGATWWLAEIINILSRPAIPVFIMLSGYLLLEKNETTKENVKRVWYRLGIPLLGWTGIYTVWSLIDSRSEVTVLGILINILSGNIFHLYFLVILINLYALLPLLRKLFITDSLNKQRTKVIFLLFAGFVYTLASYFVFKEIFSTFLTIGLPYLGYFVFGHYIKSKTIIRKNLIVLTALWIMMFLINLFLGYTNMQLFINGDQTFWLHISYFDDYLSPNVMIFSLLSFILLLHVPTLLLEKNIIKKIIRVLSAQAFGLYLVHLLVMDFIDIIFNLHINTMTDPILLYFIKRTLLTFTFSLGIVYGLRKVSFLKNIFGEKKVT